MDGTYFEISRTADRAPGAAFLQRPLGDGLMLSVVTSIPGEATGGFLARWTVDEDGRGYWARFHEIPAEQIILHD